MARRVTRSKHTVYYELVEACGEGGCPICTLVLAAVARYLDMVFYENVNDPETRDGVVSARGYCNDHSWMLREMNAALGTALMYRDVLRHAAEDIAGRQPGTPFDPFNAGQERSSLRGKIAGLTSAKQNGKANRRADPHLACPACAARERYERLYLETLADHLDDAALLSALRTAGGICLVHLDQARHAIRDAASVERLLDVQRELYLALQAEMGEFVRKNDYRYAAEPMGREGDSWVRAIEMVAGKRGIR